MSLKGSPEKLAYTIVEREFKEYSGRIEEAFKAAARLLEETRDKESSRVEKLVSQDLAEAAERLKSEESSLELQLKTAKAEAVNAWVDRVIEEAVKRALEDRGGEWYRRFMEGLVDKLMDEAGDGVFVVKVSREDMKLAEELLGKAEGRLRLSREPADIMGGLIAVSEDGDIVLDYTFELLLESIKPKIRARIARLIEG